MVRSLHGSMVEHTAPRTSVRRRGSIASAIQGNAIRHAFPYPTGLLVAGDSRTQTAGGIASSGGAYVTTCELYSNAVAFCWAATGNKLFRPPTYNYGIGATTTRCLTDRLFVASNAATGNPATNVTTIASDAKFNTQTNSEFSLAGHPANCVALLLSVNDNPAQGYYTNPKISMRDYSNILDGLRHKTVFVFNEVPRGTCLATMESKAVASHTCTATNTTGFQDGSQLTLIDGSNAGVAGVVGNNGIPYVKVTAGSEVSGVSYSVTSGGVYTFHASDSVSNVWLTYSYTGTVSTSYQITMHHWLQSSAANFTEVTSAGYSGAVGTPYGFPGALYRRPWCVSVDSWGAMESGTNTGIRGGLDSLALHPHTYACQLIGRKFATAFNTTFPNARTVTNPPKANMNNMQIATGNGSTKTWTVTLPSISSTNQIRKGGLMLVAGSVIGVDDGAGAITGTGVSGTNTVNYTTGAVTFSTTAAPANGTKIYALLDQENLIWDNPLCDTATLGTNSPTGTGTSGNFNKPWTATAANLGTCTITVNSSTIVDPDDGVTYPAIKVVLSPAGGVLGTGPTFSITNTTALAPLQAIAGTPVIGVSRVRIEPGTDGKLYGLNGAGVQLQTICSPGVVRPGAATTATVLTCSSHLGTPAFPLSNQNLEGNGYLQYESMTSVLDTSQLALTSVQLSLFFKMNSGQPASATVYFYRTSVRPISGWSGEY